MTADATRSGSLLGLSAGGFHRMAYREWGAADARRTVICVHGLTRNGRDFDALAETLAGAGRRVICPDVVGRGDSDHLADPGVYGLPLYLADMTALVARLDVAEVDWVGTSMGGLIGILLAAQAKTPIRRLVLNDIGPFVPKAALERIATYLGGEPAFPDLAAAEAYFRENYAAFGDLSDAQWRRFTAHSLRPVEPGAYRLSYDPKIAVAFKARPPEDLDLWSTWDAIACPRLVLRGASSDVLLKHTAHEMAARSGATTLVEIAGCGHAPALLDPYQIGLIKDWLLDD